MATPTTAAQSSRRLDLIASVQGGDATYYVTDGLGSTTGLVDGTGVLTDFYTYDAFGAARIHLGTSEQPFGFTGEQQEADIDNDLYYLRARFYDPSLGGFWSRDPWPGSAGSPLTLNPYSYVVGNPVNFTDPFGWCPSGLPRVRPLPTPPPRSGTAVPGQSGSVGPIIGGESGPIGTCVDVNGGGGLFGFFGTAWDNCAWWAWTTTPTTVARYGHVQDIIQFVFTRPPDCYAFSAFAAGLLVMAVWQPETLPVAGGGLQLLMEPIATSCFGDFGA